MPTATVIPRYVNQPKQAGWKASIRDSENAYWSFDPKFIPMDAFKPGEEITFDYIPETAKDGRVFNTIKRLANPHSTGQHPAPAPPLQPQKPNGVGFRPSMAPKDAQEARISLLCQAYAQAGIVPSPQDVEQLVMNVTKGVRMATPAPSPQRAEDMDDSIPY